MALNPTGVSKHAETTLCYWDVSLGLERGSSVRFILPKISAFQKFTCSVLGKHKTFHTGEWCQSTAHPHLLKLRFIAQLAPVQLIPQGQSSTLGTPQGCGGCFIPYTQSRPSRERDNLPAAQQVSWQSGRLFSLPSQNLDYFFLPYFQHVSSENQCNTRKMPLPDSSSKSGVYPALPQQFLWEVGCSWMC